MFDRIVLCPHVLAETSNLLGYGADARLAARLRGTLAELIAAAEERWLPAVEICPDPEFARLGLTDAVLMALARQAALLISADARLCRTVEARGHRAINYNHVRDGACTLEQIAALR